MEVDSEEFPGPASASLRLGNTKLERNAMNENAAVYQSVALVAVVAEAWAISETSLDIYCGAREPRLMLLPNSIELACATAADAIPLLDWAGRMLLA